MTRTSDDETSLEKLRDEVKRWQRALRAGEGAALRRFQRTAGAPFADHPFRDIQNAVAREHGFPSWLALKKELAVRELKRHSPEDLANALLALGALHYGVRPGTEAASSEEPDSPDRRQRAAELLGAAPAIALHSIHTAALCGDLAHVQRLLGADPAVASAPGGLERWPPLLFVCYGRLPTPAAADNAVAIARALLEAGADPNAHWSLRWEDQLVPWSAICGAMGEGEPGPERAPPHPHAEELVTLLLDKGADLNQGQALYNTMLRGDDDRWLRLFLGRGLDAAHRPGWDSHAAPSTIFASLLRRAAQTNQVRRAALLLEHGADPEGDGDRSLYQLAMSCGNGEVAELLRRRGAPTGPVDEGTELVSACHRRDQAAARALLERHPRLAAKADDLLIDAAAAQDRVDLAQFLLALGVSPDAEKGEGEGGYRALHQAATMNAAGVTELLLSRGAAVDPRDTRYRATPLAWALRAQALAVLDLLAHESRDVFSVVAGGLTERLRELLADPALARATLEEGAGLGVLRGEPGETPLFVLPKDEERAIVIAELLLRAGADPSKRNRQGVTAAEKARARGLLEVADLLEPAS